MGDKKSNVEQPKGARIVGGRPRQAVTKGVKVTSTTNTANPDGSKGVEIHGKNEGR